ncbi:MAG: hypothetical protein NT013_08460 [Planctomycetia bacterium]|nr:hypothetical protein [Planctomycetia bacterium]
MQKKPVVRLTVRGARRFTDSVRRYSPNVGTRNLRNKTPATGATRLVFVEEQLANEH